MNGRGFSLTGVDSAAITAARGYAVQRTNHTGVQAISTVTGLQAALDAKSTVAPRLASVASSATPTPNAGTTDQYQVTELAVDAVFGAPTGSPAGGQALLIRVKDDGSPRALSWNAVYRAFGSALPSTTVAGKTMYADCRFNATDSKWDVVAVVVEV